jgi:hypothetical protein
MVTVGKKLWMTCNDRKSLRELIEVHREVATFADSEVTNFEWRHLRWL